MALGSASLTPISMARAYAVFANGGYLVEPRFIQVIRNSYGDVIYQKQPSLICDDCEVDVPEDSAQEQETVLDEPQFRPLEIAAEKDPLQTITGARTELLPTTETEPNYAKAAITPQNAYLVRSMMMDVVRRGTGVRAMQLGRHDLAGKTGTTNEQRDAWFSGYNDHLVTSVWVGFDNHEPLGRRELGGRAALPVWMEFMAIALEGLEDSPPVMPVGLARARIDPESGLLAKSDSPNTIMEVFEAGKLPPMQQSTGGESQEVTADEDPYEIY